MILKEFRHKIDLIDKDVIELLKKRFELVEQIMDIKDSVEDKDRENDILERIKNYVENARNRDFFTKLYKTIFEESKRIQRESK
ncbi:MAG: chorismate mutase [Candidatus Delongbacteria bacterium]|nr:chorismate mutase [Candidatus Delongbacteria bacterium]